MSKLYMPTYTHDDLKVLEQTTVYQGYFQITQYQFKHRLFNGGWSKPLTREVFERGNAAAVLLVDPLLQKIVLIEQLRAGILSRSTQPWLLELVAGVIDANETPAEVVRRESQEEAGLPIQALLPITEYWASPGATSEKISLFCARVDATAAGGVHGLVDEGEDIKVHVFTVAEVFELLAQGQFRDAPTIIAVQWLRLHEQQIMMRLRSAD